MTVNVSIVFSSTPGVSFVSSRVESVEIIDSHSDESIDFTGPGAEAAKAWAADMNEVVGSSRFVVMVDGGWAV
jgi:hypothetical protein